VHDITSSSWTINETYQSVFINNKSNMEFISNDIATDVQKYVYELKYLVYSTTVAACRYKYMAH